MSRRYKIISDVQNVHGNARARPSRAEVEPFKIYWWCMGCINVQPDCCIVGHTTPGVAAPGAAFPCDRFPTPKPNCE